MSVNSSATLGQFHSAVQDTLADIDRNGLVERIWTHDHTVWKDDPADIQNRLGWLRAPHDMEVLLPEIAELVESVRSSGYTHVLLLGMGGSSLAAEMFRSTFGVREHHPDLTVLDSTDPGAVLSLDDTLDPHRTLYLVSTKSGGTVETLSFMKFFYNRAVDALGKEGAGEHFVAVTDPGSPLEETAGALQFRKACLNNPEIGGRYSALSYFGLVPAGLIGMDLDRLLEASRAMTDSCGRSRGLPASQNPGAWLGAIMGELAAAGRDKLTLVVSPPLFRFGSWVEQLIAESTGKEGKGILPVIGEQVLVPEAYREDRLFVYLRLEGDRTYDKKIEALESTGHPVVRIAIDEPYDLGGEIFRWEMATAIAGSILRINPFDQPNVESAKVRAKQMVSAYQQDGRLPEPEPAWETEGIRVYADFIPSSLEEALTRFLEDGVEPTLGYISLQAYLEPSRTTDEALQELRDRLQVQCGTATTVGYGPRFLHSTGQLHKGDAGRGRFIQLTGTSLRDAEIPNRPGDPESSISFGTLKMAQAMGDRRALVDAGRRVIRFHLESEIPDRIRRLAHALEE